MIKILIKINKNSLIFKEKQKLSSNNKSLINTSVINKNELIFSDEYIKFNQNIVSSFLKELCQNNKINTIIIEKEKFAELILNLFTKNSEIINLILKEDKSITYNICELIIKTNIKNVNCYNIQPFMIELFDKHQIIVESRNEILFISNFMKKNNLITLSNIYYKTSLNFELPINQQDIDDFEGFCQLNNRLKSIHLTNININDLEIITDILKSSSHKNIKIIIHENITNAKILEYLKDFNKTKKNKYKIQYVLKYSDSYIQKNFLKQTNSKILSSCCFIIILQ